MPFQTDTEVGTQEDSWGLIEWSLFTIISGVVGFLIAGFCNFLPAIFEMLEAM